MDLIEIGAIAADLVRGTPNTCVYLGGSRAVGWQHQSSDVDLFVITETEIRQPTGLNLDVTVAGPAPAILISYHRNVRFDVECWTESQIGELIDRLATPSVREQLSHGDIDVLWRLHTGHHLLGDVAWFKQRQALVAVADLSRELARRAVYSAEVRLDDAAGLLTADEPIMAALSAREAFGRVVDALLSHSGSPAPPSKWRLRRLRESSDFERLYQEYVAVETMAGFDPSSPARWVRSLVLRSRELLKEVDV